MFTTRFQAWVRRNAQRVARLLAALPVTPNMVTVSGMLATFGAAVLAGFGHLRWAGVVLAFAGTFDILDGALARATNRSYPYGAFLDSTTDRCSEVAVYAGVAAFFLGRPGPFARWEVLACLLALAGSFLVSYVRARAQSLGFKCDSGLFARPERVVLTVGALLIGVPDILGLVIAVLAVMTTFTALQRIFEVYLQARAQRRSASGSPARPPAGVPKRPVR